MGGWESIMLEPNTEKISNDGDGAHVKYGASSVQGYRVTQEDAHNSLPEFDLNTSYFAVYDGHNGHEVAAYTAENLPSLLRDSSEYIAGNLSKALIDTFLDFDKHLGSVEGLKKLKNLKVLSKARTSKNKDGSSLPKSETDDNKTTSIVASNMKISVARDDSGSSEVGSLNSDVSLECNGHDPGIKCVDSSVMPVENGDLLMPEDETNTHEVPVVVCKKGDSAKDEMKVDNVKIDSVKDQKEVDYEKTSGNVKDEKQGDEENSGSLKDDMENIEETDKSLKDEKMVLDEKMPAKQQSAVEIVKQSNQDPLAEPSDTARDDKIFQATDGSSNDANAGEKEQEKGQDKEEEEEQEADEEQEAVDKEVPGVDSGCTAVVAVLRGRDLYVANAGDSRCVLCRNGKAVNMSHDHKPSKEEEKKRIVNAGGIVSWDNRVNDNLNLSRAFGDHLFKQNLQLRQEDQMISALPDVQTFVIDPKQDEFMILACDGIWDKMSSQDVVDFVRERLPTTERLSTICEELFDYLLTPERHSSDNMTAIIVKFLPSIANAVQTLPSHGGVNTAVKRVASPDSSPEGRKRLETGNQVAPEKKDI